jgi:molecular chaperone DnaJ
MRRDYYAVLGVAPTTGPREIRQAYRRLARQYSPDVNFWDRDARALYQEIDEAYRVLTDPAARAMYDRFGHRGIPAADGDERSRRGEDIHATVNLSFADAAGGVALGIDLSRFSPCSACGARGFADGEPCARCLSRGVERTIETVRVVVPPGVDSGAQLRIPGEGHAGPVGGPRGDLIVSTRVAEHPFFRRTGDALHCEVPISVWEALCGARIRIPTPLGETAMIVAPGIVDGRVLRLRGHGMPKLSGEGRGDLYVTIRIEVPGGIDVRTQELVTELARLMPMELRADLARFRGGLA